MKILLIAYGFPPASSSSTFRPMFFAKHLQEMGNTIFVLTIRAEDYLPGHPKDPDLLKKLDDHIMIFRGRVFRPKETLMIFRDRLFKKTAAVSQHKASSLPDSVSGKQGKKGWFQEIKNIITDCLSTPDQQIGWLPSAVYKGIQIIKQQQIDIIYTTGGPWTSLLIGGILKKMTRTPVVMDFRDPWVANPSRASDSQLLQRVEPFLEKHVIAIADHIIANTEELRQDFLRRYSFLSKNRITTIPNGFEEYIPSQQNLNFQLTLVHAGMLYFSRNPRYLLQAMINGVEKHHFPADQLQLFLLGGFDVSLNDPELHSLLSHPCLQRIVKILPRVPYQEAIEYQKRSDVLLLLQPDFPLQIPRKLYEYIAFQKPLFAITNLQGATANIIQNNHLGIVVENRTEDIEPALITLYHQWKDRTLSLFSATTCDRFLNKNLTYTLDQVFRKYVECS